MAYLRVFPSPLVPRPYALHTARRSCSLTMWATSAPKVSGRWLYKPFWHNRLPCTSYQHPCEPRHACTKAGRFHGLSCSAFSHTPCVPALLLDHCPTTGLLLNRLPAVHKSALGHVEEQVVAPR